MKGVRELKVSGEVSRKAACEEAVAPVIALMLILAVVATFISLYSTEYLPGLKEQSEIAQVSEIKEAFMDFSNDIGHIVSEKKGASYGHTIPLGAGDVIMSPEKSSGTLSVSDAGTIFDIYNNSSGDPVASAAMVKAEFKPSYTFWEGQGYSWQYGYINVTKDDIEVPLEYYEMADVIDDFENSGGLSIFAKSFVDFDPEDDGDSNLTSLEIDLVTLIPGENNFVSGNSMTTLKIETVDPSENTVSYDNVTTLSFRFENITGEGLIPEFSTCIFEKINSSMADLAYDNIDSVETDSSSDGGTITLIASSPFSVVIKKTEIVVSAG
ncbi:hypothetical protein [Methanolacinia paynteri]|uniref:hypothetical protein n=1 Tax=Methanolacinia paynteri TaxID=230356 RepID=UPI00064F456F|nr:hypothetical protein [Methanolacinia paynteri]